MLHSADSDAGAHSLVEDLIDARVRDPESPLPNQVYAAALVESKTEHLTGQDGAPINWLMDARVPLLDGALVHEIGIRLANRVRARTLTQVAGLGLGAFAMVSAAIHAPGQPPLRGGYIRAERKPHGRHRRIEGPITQDRPVALVDDVLNSGTSAVAALELMRAEGFEVQGFVSAFGFLWGTGRDRLEREGLWVETLMELTLGNGSG